MGNRAGLTRTARTIAGMAALAAAFASVPAAAETGGPAGSTPWLAGTETGSLPELGVAGTEAGFAALETDVRWLPWIGCWSQTGAASGGMWTGESELLCVLPSNSGVEIHTVFGDRTVSIARLSADGQPIRVEESGCEGWRSADWSPDGRRVYLRSELECEGGTRRTSSGIMAMSPGGEWVDVQSIDAAGQTATRALRYRQAAVPAHLSERLDRFVADKAMALETARVAAAARLQPADVIEIVDRAGTAATAALLIERDDRFRLDAATLRSLDAAGVPADIVDLMVALAYPDRFVIDPIAGTAEVITPEPFRGTPRGYDPVRRPGRLFAGGICPGYYDPFGRFGYFGQPLYGYGQFGSPVFGFGTYGACPRGFGGLYGRGWRVGPVVPIVVRDSGTRVVKGRGYTSRGTGDSARPARPARPAAGTPATSSGRSPAATPSGGRSSGDSSGGRRAKPRSNNDNEQ